MTAEAQTFHATAVALNDRGVLILGATGQGKSDLALQLMALGAGLVADDAVCLTAKDGDLIASAPPNLPPLIEARGIGLLHATLTGPVTLVLAIDLDRTEQDRLPQMHQFTALGCAIPLIRRTKGGNLAAAVIQLIRTGRSAP